MESLPRNQRFSFSKAHTKRSLRAQFSALLLTTCALVSSTSRAQTVSISSDARNFKNAMVEQGFKCTSNVGYRCRGKIAGYSQPINFFFGPSFSMSAPLALGYHFHGYVLSSAFDPFSSSYGQFDSYINSSGQNVIMISPESTGKSATYNSDLNTLTKLNSFFTNVDLVLSAAHVPISSSTTTFVSGHSAAYTVLGRIGTWVGNGTVPRLKNLRGVALFDSAYGYRSGLVDFGKVLRANEPALYYSIHNPNDGETLKHTTNLRIKKELGPARIENGKPDIVFLTDTKIEHMMFVRTHLAEFLKLANFAPAN